MLYIWVLNEQTPPSHSPHPEVVHSKACKTLDKKAPWSLILSRYSRELAFLGETGVLTLPPPNRRFPRPLPAASAAGGRGNSDSRCVHSVEELGCADGGVGRVAALPVFCFAGAGLPPRRRRSGGAPKQIRVLRRARSSEELLWATSPCRSSTAATPALIFMLQAALQQAWRVDVGGAGWRPCGVRVPTTSRPPGDIGRSKECGDAAAARHRCDLVFVGVNAVQKLDLGVISSFVEVLSVIGLF